jgi:hypothetical protein
MRVVTLGIAVPAGERRRVAELLIPYANDNGSPIEVLTVKQLPEAVFSPHDIWVPTYWTTAHALDIASRLGKVDPKHVVYLIQDYEPGFFPWSSEYSLASATYHAGFIPLVNSEPLRRYIELKENVSLPSSQTFAPQLDLARLEATALARSRDDAARVLFYGRPSKPRNMFNIGVGALRVAQSLLSNNGINVRVRSIGELHPSVQLGRGTHMRSIGRVGWNQYFELLADSDVLFSLQASPHPSHPPLDAIASGGWAVMNDLDGSRNQLHPRLMARRPDPDELGEAIVEGIRNSSSSPIEPRLDSEFLASLGGDLNESLDAAIGELND